MSETARRHILSTVCILGFFVIWEILCLIFNVSDIVLPRPSEIMVTLWTRFPAIWPHAVQTLIRRWSALRSGSSSAYCSGY